MLWSGLQLQVSTRRTVGPGKESEFGASGWYREAMIGRCHYGDENGNTTYEFGRVSFPPVS